MVAHAFLGTSELAKLPDEALQVIDALGGFDNSAATSGTIAARVRDPPGWHERMFWWEHAPIGDIAVFLRHPYHFIREMLQSFCNVQQHPLPTCDGDLMELSENVEKMRVTPGTPSREGMHVHVAVGFVDLGELAATLGKLKDEHYARGEENKTSYACEGKSNDMCLALVPVRWVGYEASAHACARTLVIVQMLEDKAPVDSIVQVRF